ncbi:hypothetical protein LTR36_005507 [Oleoguttula mirabilis]|uniref:Polysaccharide export protein n=1 Tax=Oleoguttula mirabilis TaxID=1507867 RepID=A0AAV9JE26_9PEZI|nr:hypothetical protein LTR36_005507 [Oleoguttula mirabilis]
MLVRPRWRRLAFNRATKILAFFLAFWTVLDVVNVRRHLLREAQVVTTPFSNQKIFIASIHWTDEAVLRSHWAPAVAELARAIGSENVYVSIYESGSLDATKDVLQILDTDLEMSGIRRKIVLDETTHKDEIGKPPAESGWIQMPSDHSYRQNWTDWFTLEKDTWVPRRIPYLARSRNLVMQPLYELQQSGERFDKVLWLNDVVFDTDDVRRLLATRGGEYAAACALDFKRPPMFYDTFALRDAEGNEPLMETWPYFQSRESRNAVMRGQPTPVASCWNGMVVFDAAPFYDIQRPLVFRGIADGLAASHLEGSECCLVHADNPLSQSKGVWVNPQVRVGYNGTAYGMVNPDSAGSWPSSFAIAEGLWRNRLKRWLHAFQLKDRTVETKLQRWKDGDAGHHEPGSFCLIDEMQVMLWNGWGHA